MELFLLFKKEKKEFLKSEEFERALDLSQKIWKDISKKIEKYLK